MTAPAHVVNSLCKISHFRILHLRTSHPARVNTTDPAARKNNFDNFNITVCNAPRKCSLNINT